MGGREREPVPQEGRAGGCAQGLSAQRRWTGTQFWALRPALPCFCREGRAPWETMLVWSRLSGAGSITTLVLVCQGGSARFWTAVLAAPRRQVVDRRGGSPHRRCLRSASLSGVGLFVFWAHCPRVPEGHRQTSLGNETSLWGGQ